MPSCAIPSSFTDITPVDRYPTAEELRQAHKTLGIEDPYEAMIVLLADKWAIQTDRLGMCNNDKRSIRDLMDRRAILEKENENRRGVD